MSTLTVIGVDPGRTTGIAALHFSDATVGLISGTNLVQCNPESVSLIVDTLIGSGWPTRVVAVERFVVGPRAGRSQDAKAGEITRRLISDMHSYQGCGGVRVHARSAAEVKPWAVDARLAAIGIRMAGMPHAKDAARHALFCAVRDYGVPDPLSKRARGTT